MINPKLFLKVHNAHCAHEFILTYFAKDKSLRSKLLSSSHRSAYLASPTHLHLSSQGDILPGLAKTYGVFNSASKCIEIQYIYVQMQILIQMQMHMYPKRLWGVQFYIQMHWGTIHHIQWKNKRKQQSRDIFLFEYELNFVFVFVFLSKLIFTFVFVQIHWAEECSAAHADTS